MSFFYHLPTFSPDSILGLQKLFLEDARAEKVNLVIGVFESPNKKYGGFSSVRKAQNVFLEDEINKRYLPVIGLGSYLDEMRDLSFGDIDPDNVFGCQALGGTGALHVGALVFSMAGLSGKVFIPEQTWGNHIRIFAQQGLQVERYPYYDVGSRGLDFSKTLSALRNAPEKSLVLFHCCCHNPTGVDFTENMWNDLAAVCKERNLLPFFDMAYLGFAENLESDRRPVRIFIDAGLTVFIAGCASKNFALYGERVGYFAVHSTCKDDLERISSCVQEKVRGEYSSPVRDGAMVVSTILSNPYLRQEWISELDMIRTSLQTLRTKFVQEMRSSIGHSFDFIGSQRGFFGYPGFSTKQVDFLREEKGIYTTSGGRFNLNGITNKNMQYVIQGFSEAYELSESS
ncbi:aminotransferase class I and II family protein [Chlamydia ibidis]|uniref:Aminotransferase class I and II family protein n=2 Tax=Chlamydia ibidis TaxID=1405396 RepID=S7J400_9CHLA|nr:aromatic amino acid transaminase [Chlamydia ibidis]EPP34727.1 aminotransferase class I and II family protein [Chlamydia ibidis]EQM62955.1 aminotransferase class I and II family protein [Chlamydia ibidis 10-1398/6]